jgi:hypothetical protein
VKNNPEKHGKIVKIHISEPAFSCKIGVSQLAFSCKIDTSELAFS